MTSRLRDFFIPHENNNFHPHALHHKRILFYGVFGITIKTIAVSVAVLLPAQAFVIPEVLVKQQEKVIDLTNEVRVREGVSPITYVESLGQSSLHKATDMAEKVYFEHVSPEGKKLKNFLEDVGYRYSVAGENLAVGFSSPEAMVKAWVESPTHFSNLIDPDFKDIGVGSAVGMYGGNLAVYVAQHFGNPTEHVSTIEADSRTRIRGISVTNPEVTDQANQYYDFGVSNLNWKSENNSIQIHANARIVGNISRAAVTAQGYTFELFDTHEDNLWSGTLTVPESPEHFFEVVLPPEITITWSDGEITHSVIEWQYVPVVPMGTLQKYETAKLVPRVLGTLSPATRGVLYGLIIFFSLALILKIVVQVRHQHYHVIASTLALIVFLTLLVLA